MVAGHRFFLSGHIAVCCLSIGEEYFFVMDVMGALGQLGGLTFAILNEYFELTQLPDGSKYMAAFILVALHLYILRYCKCTMD